MHLVALVESLEHVCCRYRLRAFVSGLEAHGHTLEFQELPRGIARWRIGSGLGHADLVILQRKMLPRWQLALLRQRVRRLAFDFDDAVYQRDSYHRKGPQCLKLWPRFAATMRAADIVVAGNSWLADRALDEGARAVRLIPTCIDVGKYRASSHRQSGNLTLVWVGTASTIQGLARARPLLEHLGRSIPGLKLRFVCDSFLEFDHLQVEQVPWDETWEAEAIASADIGLSLLPDDDWSRGKCGLKVLQYLASGLPVIGNPVGVTAELLGTRPGQEAGVLVDSPREWVEAITLLSDPTTRLRMGGIGRRRVEQHYAIDMGLKAWLHVLDEIAQAGRIAG
ncbi:MAG: glycosyltransferase family 4 protein [Gemmataceae bacterium]